MLASNRGRRASSTRGRVSRGLRLGRSRARSAAARRSAGVCRSVVLGGAALAVVVLLWPASALAQTPCTGTVKVTDTDNNTVLGYVSTQWNSFGEYGVTNDPSQYLTVSFDPGSAPFDITATNGPNASDPLVVGIQGYSSTNANLGPGSSNYAYLGGGTATPANSPALNQPNSFTAATGISEGIESSIWSLGAGNQLLPQWVNTDSSTPATYLVLTQGVLVMTGDTSAFENTFGSSQDVGLNLVGGCSTESDPHTSSLQVASASGDYADSTPISATLTDTTTNSPASGQKVSFTLDGNETCSATTDGSGVARRSITPSEAAGGYTLAASFAGTSSLAGVSNSNRFQVTLEESSLSYTGDTSGTAGQPFTMSGTLTTDGTGLSGKMVTFTLGSGSSAQSCSGTTESSGNASCTLNSLNQPVGPGVPISASFASDGYYHLANASSSASVFSPAAAGAFVVGDASAGGQTTGTLVNFWGSQWAKKNQFSGSSAPASMKGFANVPTALRCGSTFTTSPGASSVPPATLPGVIEVIVAGKVTKSGSTISGTVEHLVFVNVNPGYGPDPSQAGYGTIISTIC